MLRTRLALIIGLMAFIGAEASALTPDKLSGKRAYGPELVQTALAMQRHTEWVSSSTDKVIKDKLGRKRS